MFVVNSLPLAIVFCVITMLGWGSWANTQKLAGKEKWPFQLFYWDYAIGVFALSILTMASLGVAVDVIAWTRSLQPGVVANDDGNPAVYRMGRFREWDTTMPHTMNLVDWLCSLRSYDAVWGHYLSPAGFLAAWIGRLKGIRSTVSIRGNDLDRDMFPPGAAGDFTFEQAQRSLAPEFQLREPRKTFRFSVATTF